MVVHSFPFDIPVFRAVLTVLPAGVATPFTFPRVIDERERERESPVDIAVETRLYPWISPSFDIFW